jgi:ComF family protein
LIGLFQRAGLVPARFFLEASRAALDLLYPPVCYSCGARDAASALCDPCALEIFSRPGPTSGHCGRVLRAPPHPCRDCAQTAFSFTRARGTARYSGLCRALIRRFKLGAEPHLARPLGALLADLAERECPRPDAVAYVPLSRLKLLRRGFNQAELLAESVAARLGRPLLRGALRRLRRPGKQAFLTRAARLAHARGLFAPGTAAVAGKRLLLVDDVITTGATASACAEALRSMGAAEVTALAVGR